MKVKRYLVDDLPQAVQQIRSELGSDAVILNTKEIRTGGFLGMFRKKRMEVIAAVDESAKPQARPSAKPIVRPQAEAAKKMPNAALPVTDPAVDSDPARGAGEQAPQPLPASAIRQRYGGGASAGPAPTSEKQQASAAAEAAASLLREVSEDHGRPNVPAVSKNERTASQTSFDEAMSRALASARALGASDRNAPEAPQPAAAQALRVVEPTPASAQAAAVPLPQTAAAGETAELLAELRAMKDLLRQQAGREPAPQRMPEQVLRLSRLLAQQGVVPVYVEEFAAAVSAKLKEREANNEGDVTEIDLDRLALNEAHALLLSWLAPAQDAGIATDTHIVHFVGPTGVGKTTTIAKLGADQVLSRRRTVGFITADTYRIAAVDQLRTYADILNVPLEVVFSPSELARAYKRLEDRDLLLMDTAGRNYRNELYVSEVNSLLSPGQEAEKILVLSLTHKYQDMRKVSAQFVKYGVSRLLLTKMDETDSYGAILNLVREFGFSIPYVTFGQTVPDDIRPFDPAWLASKLLEGEPAHA
ncbi:flagellar biosynthesis protein FlhF [Cohnella hashimotonis]|uniref:Flagellar biosynthesis protein FlhF n=1 Tax=Cohnella hashimotonis TaxID=2826895 RepID=A0ABT6TH86_9BACL|nr:flagellar biosynthesis protein FlhF [Cohnella hashimotonis]MDI4646203.1 flagellar biosynthesis protein FlhF [Cohnella hashimotonis]